MMQVPDEASIAAMWWLEARIGRKVGSSTGTNLWGALKVVEKMREKGEQGSIVTLLCDGGERYLDTHHNRQWVAEKIGDPAPYLRELERW